MDVYILVDTNKAARDCILSVHERLVGAELAKHDEATRRADADHQSELSFTERYRRLVEHVLVIINKDTRDGE
jgi:hypothetical protein